MNPCKDISCNLKNQSVLILEMSATQNIQGLDPKKYMHEDADTFMLNRGHQTVCEKMLFPGPKCVDLVNPYIELCFTSNDSSNESHLDNTGNAEKVYNKNNNPCRGETTKQAMPWLIIKNESYSLKESSPNAIENKAIHKTSGKSLELTEKNQQETIQLMKSTDEPTASKKGAYEDGEIATKCFDTGEKIRFKTEKEFCVRNPCLEFILKPEDSKSHLCVTGRNCEAPSTNNIASSRERKTDEKFKRRNKKSVDIFGKCLTSKDCNKFKVVCPHCMRKVSAPGFVRHLSYCMRASVRKSTRRS